MPPKDVVTLTCFLVKKGLGALWILWIFLEGGGRIRRGNRSDKRTGNRGLGRVKENGTEYWPVASRPWALGCISGPAGPARTRGPCGGLRPRCETPAPPQPNAALGWQPVGCQVPLLLLLFHCQADVNKNSPEGVQVKIA